MELAIFRLLFIVILVGVDVGTAIYYRYVEEIDTKVQYFSAAIFLLHFFSFLENYYYFVIISLIFYL